MKAQSIAFRLIIAVLSVELVSSLVVVFLSLGYERHVHFVSFDIMLRGRADSVLGAVQDAGDAADNVMLDQADLHLPAEDMYEVRDESGRLLGRSPNWKGNEKFAPSPQCDGFMHLTVNHVHYRFLRVQGSRIVDPGETNGAKSHQITVLYGAPTEHVWHAIRGAVEFYAAGSLVLLIVTGPLIVWLLHRGLLPLRQLAALASHVSVDSWQFAPPSSAYTTPELAPLTHALESVLKRLEHAFVQQQTFVSDAAHELKTGVAVVKSSLQLLGIKQRTADEYRAGLERCLDDTHRLEQIVADMLILARAESSTPAPGPQPAVDMSECIRRAIVQLDPIAELRNVKVLITGSSLDAALGPIHVPLAAGDCALLLSNLLLNALQHSSPASTVEVRLTAHADTAVLELEDHGNGIAPDALPHVFERFFRGDPSRTRNTGGTGLGLSICKAVVGGAGGSIHIASQPGHGTVVTVRLPLTSTSPSPVPLDSLR